MVASPGPKHTDPTRQLRQEIDDLKAALRQVANRQPFPFSVVYDSSGVGTPPFVNMFSVVNSGWTDASGHPIPTTTIKDAQGNVIFAQSPAAFSGSVASSWYWALQDAHADQVIATDGLAGRGLAFPFIPVPVFAKWNGGSFQTATSTGAASAVASSIVGMGNLWEGRIGYVSHPAISVDGIWGDIDNSGVTPSYSLLVNGSSVGTWTGPSGQVYAKHVFDIHTLVGSLDATVGIQVTSTGGAVGTDRIACQVVGVHLRQTPASFG